MGIKLIGDLPIYVGYDSADVWANRKLFQVTPKGGLEFQAGCPPCKYEEEGQIWGNPLYNWELHEADEFSWWKKRFQKLFRQVDIIRLDHFIGFAKYYKIPIESQTARNGEWVSSPGEKLFSALKDIVHKENVIAEDLGDITPEIHRLRKAFHFPGMRVMHFEFPQIIRKDEIPENTTLYLGTHDNSTHLGWLEGLSPEELENYNSCMDEIELVSHEEVYFKPIKWLLNTKADKVILQLQDVLYMDNSCRMNIPGTISEENWGWRMKKWALNIEVMYKIRTLTKDSNRHQSIERVHIEG